MNKCVINVHCERISIFMKTKLNFQENFNSVVFWILNTVFHTFLSWVGLYSTKFLWTLKFCPPTPSQRTLWRTTKQLSFFFFFFFLYLSLWSISFFMKTEFNFPENPSLVVFWLVAHQKNISWRHRVGKMHI